MKFVLFNEGQKLILSLLQVDYTQIQLGILIEKVK